MSAPQLQGVGSQVRDFLLGLLQGAATEERAPAAAAAAQPLAFSAQGWSPTAPAAAPSPYPDQPLIAPDPNKVTVGLNVSARLPSGSLIIGTQKDGRIYRYTPATDETEIVCAFHNTPMVLWDAALGQDGQFYAAMSGTRRNNPDNPNQVLFGQGGCIVSISLRDEAFSIVPNSGTLTDPAHLRWLPNGNLLVVDFEGFGGSGALYEMDPISGSRTTIARGQPLIDPCAAAVAPDGAIYVANPRQSYSFEKVNGKWQKDSGSIVRVDRATGEMKTVYDEFGDPRGGIVGVHATPDERSVIVVRGDWPTMSGSALLVLDVTTGKARTLIEATPETPRFWGHSAVETLDGRLYAVDSVRKEMHVIDIAKGSLLETKSMHAILGPTVGMTTSMETVEFLCAIP